MKEIHIIGLGGAGCNALEYVHRQGVQAKYTCITDPQRLHLSPEIDSIQFSPPVRNHFKYGKLFVQLSDMDRNFSVPQEITDLFENDNKFVLLAGLGGYTGSFLIEKLFPWLQAMDKDYLTICSLPYTFEGQDRRALAESMKITLQYFPNFKWFRLDTLRDTYGNLTLRDAFLTADKEFYAILNKELGLSGKIM